MAETDSLYSISESIVRVIEDGMDFDPETGEVLFDESDLDELAMRLEDKLDSTASYIRSQKAVIDQIKAEEKRLSERRKTLEKAVSRLERYVVANLGKVPKNSIVRPLQTISIRHTKKVDVFESESLPEKYVRVREVREPDKKEIKKAIMSGEDVPGACVVVNETLSIK